ncbi:hypothetical protein [uncultured Amnibacterium sp.]|uniref:hypothetical protein n=1 Tax=uncultured Amnibacterium sp. TaxID=1631851 RepID=UPI0035CC1F42
MQTDKSQTTGSTCNAVVALGVVKQIQYMYASAQQQAPFFKKSPARETTDLRLVLSEDMTVLRVLCSIHELEEDGEVVRIGDHIRRLASRNEIADYGTDLDNIEWHLDHEAEAAGDPAPTISGRVAAISAIYVRLTGSPGHGWTAQHGSAHLEPLESTAATRHVQHTINWGPTTAPDEQGHVHSAG